MMIINIKTISQQLQLENFMIDPLKLFQNSNTYKHHIPRIRSLIQEPHYQTIINIFHTIYHHLHQPQYNPFSKLLMMRFLRECILCANYPMLIMIDAHLVERLFQFATYRKSSMDPERGKRIFLDYQGKQHTPAYLKTIGFSFHKIVLEMLQVLGTLMKNVPHHEEPCLPSMVSRKYDSLLHLNVKLIQEFTYFQARDLKEFKKNYARQQKIKPFYEFLFKQLLCDSKKTLPIVKNIIRSGDMYCSQFLLRCLKKYIQKQQEGFDYFIVVNELFLVGEVQMIFQIGKELLLELIEGYGKGLIPSRYGKEITAWGFLLVDVEEVDVRIRRVFLEVSKQVKGCQPREVAGIKKDFINQLRNLRSNNNAKAKFIDFTNSYEEDIIEALKCLPKNHQFQPIQLEFEVQQVELQKKSSRKMMNYRINGDTQRTPSKKSSKQYSLHPYTPEYKNKILPHTPLKQELKKYRSQKCPSFIDTLKMDEQARFQTFKLDSLALKTRKKRILKIKTGQNQTCPNFSDHHSQTQKKLRKTLDDYQFKQLEHQVEVYKLKEQKLNTVIKQQTKLIQKLQGELTSTKNRSSLITSMQNISTVRQSRRKIFERPERLEKFLTPKLKSDILKKKILLFKSSYIEIGLITNLNQSICEVSFYITPLVSLEDVKAVVKSPPWINHSFIENETKSHAPANIQYIIQCMFTFIDTKGFLSLPELTILYTNNCLPKEVKVFLPIFITKFCQQKEVNKVEIKNKIQEGIFQAKIIKKEGKILGSFEHFSKYFKNAIIIEDDLFASKFIFEGIILYLVIHSLDKKNAKVSLISEAPDLLQGVLLKAFVSLLGV